MKLVPLSLAAALLSACSFGTARAQNTAGEWQTYAYSASGSLKAKAATPVGNDLADFVFPASPSLALLTTTSDSAVLGNLTGRTITATFTVPATSGNPTFVYGGEGASWNPCVNPANVRLFVSSSAKTYSASFASKASNETDYWWSNPVSYQLATTTTAVSLSDTLSDPSQWSDANGHFGNDPAYTAGFAATVASVAQIGFSYGGGCFFDVGVGATGGTASFDVSGYTAS